MEAQPPTPEVQSWQQTVQRWVDSLSDARKRTLFLIGKARGDSSVYEKLKAQFPEDVLESIRRDIETFQTKFGWSYRLVISTLYVYLCGSPNLPPDCKRALQ